MTLMVRLLKWTLKALLAAVAIVFVMALGILLFVGLTPVGGRVAADRISALISTPDRGVSFSAPEGLLSGDLKIDTLVLSDDRGPYAELGGIRVDWSPGSLIGGVFRAEYVTADTVNLIRAPLPPKEPQPAEAAPASDGGSSLPVGIRVAQIDLPDINLSESLSGRDFSLSLKGSIDATGPDIAIDLQASRKDEPNAKASVDVVYAPTDNRLTLQANVSEPEGGLLARLLRLPGAPAVELALDGEGPLSDWAGKLRGSVGDVPVISIDGTHQTVEGNRNRIEIDGGGQLATLLPPALRPLFGGTTDINVAATYDPSGRVNIQRGEIASDAVKLTAKGAWDPAGDNSLTASLAGVDGPVDFVWPIDGQQSRFLFESFNFTLNGPATAARFNATAALDAAVIPQGRFDRIRLQAESEDLDLIKRTGSVRSRLTVGGTDFVSDDLDRVIRGPVTLDAPIRLAPQAIGLDASTFDSANLNGTLSGAYDMAKQAVTGNFRVFANPAVLPPALSSKFEGKLSAEGYVNVVTDGPISVENFVMQSSSLEAHGNVLLQDGKIEGRLAGRVPELRRWLPEAEGAAGFDVTAEGPLSAVGVRGVVNSAEARLVGRKLQHMSLVFNGTADPKAPSGTLTASGSLDGQPIRINTDIQSADGRTSVPVIDAEIGPNKLNGSLTFSPEFLPEGQLTFNFPDVGLLAALAAQQAEGDLAGTVMFSNTGGKAGAAIRASGTAVKSGAIEIVKPDIDLAIPDIKALSAQGSVRAARIGAGAAALVDVDLGVEQELSRTDFNLKAQYDNAPLNLVGDLQTGPEISVGLESFTAKPRNIPVRLADPTRIVIADGGARFDGLTLATGSGGVTVEGQAGATLDVKATIKALPANLINSFVPAINAAGSISGTVTATGTAADPKVQYDLEWNDAQLRQTRDAGISAFQLQASGNFADKTLTLDKTRLTAPGGLNLAATGRVLLQEDGPALDINARAEAIPASLINAFAPSLGASGTISGTVMATGTPQAPSVRYDLRWANAGLAQTTSAGIASLDITANGTFANNKVTVDTRLTGGGGIALSGNGSVSLAGAKPLDLKLNGQLPFSILAGPLAAQGFLLEGTGRVDLGIGGTASAPAITGTASTSGSRFVDVRRNLAITGLGADIAFNGSTANISRLGGKLSSGGSVSVRGSVGITPASGFPADLTITLDQASYADGKIIAATVDGALTITGPLTAGPTLGGRLTLDKAAITVPAKLPSSLSAIDIRHRNAPADVQSQIDELNPEEAEGASRPITLDLQISAPNGIFVRGRGIDAELGGNLRVTGNALAPVIAGGFEMRRGRIVILTKRLDFTNGEITFGGGLIPILNMEARTSSAQTTIIVKVTGVANDPNISFSSSPALPQDEVLARLIFGQSMARLSPLQIAQLASAAAQLAGGGSNSLLDTLRNNLGVDDLDINTDSSGQTTVSVGRYINDRTYFQVEQGGSGGAEATINLDVGRGVKLKAGAGTEGGKAGIFFEHEY